MKKTIIKIRHRYSSNKNKNKKTQLDLYSRNNKNKNNNKNNKNKKNNKLQTKKKLHYTPVLITNNTLQNILDEARKITLDELQQYNTSHFKDQCTILNNINILFTCKDNKKGSE